MKILIFYSHSWFSRNHCIFRSNIPNKFRNEILLILETYYENYFFVYLILNHLKLDFKY